MSEDNRLVTRAIERMHAYQPGRSIEGVRLSQHLDAVIKLASNENPLGPSPKAVEAMAAALGGVHRYATEEDARALLQEIARRLDVAPDQIVLTAGITDLIELAVRTFTTPEDHALVSAGSFVAYRLFLTAASVPFTEVPLGPDLAIDLDAMAAAVEPRTKLVFLPNPNNPTGSRFGTAALARFAGALPAKVVLFLDDAYIDFQEDEDVPDTLALVGSRPRTLVARGFSKAYGLSGLRLGYGIASPELARYLRKVHRPFAVSRLALAAGLAALTDFEHIERTRAVVREGRAFLTESLRELGCTVLPSYANFVTVHMGSEAAAVDFARELLKEGLIVRPLAAFGLPEHVRISVGTETENRTLVAAVQALRHPPARR